MAISNNLKVIRKQKKLTQQELANAVKVDERTIRNIESTGSCSLEIALLIAAYLETSVENIFRISNDRS